jgi:hypothetical protein
MSCLLPPFCKFASHKARVDVKTVQRFRYPTLSSSTTTILKDVNHCALILILQVDTSRTILVVQNLLLIQNGGVFIKKP